MSSRWSFWALLLLLLSACGGGIYHTVRPGQTLYRISRTYHINEATLARVNHITDPTQLRAGTRLFIPGADRVRAVVVVKSSAAGNRSAVKRPPIKKKTTAVAAQKQKRQRYTPRAAVKKTPVKRAARSTEIKKLQWPLRGKIVRSFSVTAKAGGGKGIEIAVKTGSSVRAAEAGKVIYSGDGVQGYGHLIILQHENDLFTVYGFNRRNLVRQGDFVSKGEKIALSGVPPGGGVPRMHFEVRRGKRAVNPILYLP